MSPRDRAPARAAASRAHRLVALAATAAASGFGACHQGGAPPAAQAELRFEAVGLLPVADRALDRPLWVLCNEPIDPAQMGGPVGGPGGGPTGSFVIEGVEGPGAHTVPRGELRVRSLPDGAFADSVLEFVPALPTPDEPSPGLAPATRYTVTLPAGGLRSVAGRTLAHGATFSFQTRDGSTPRELYSPTLPGGPHATFARGAPLDEAGRLHLGQVAHGRAEIRVDFDQPLSPSPFNVPARSDSSARGSVWLLYDDAEFGPDRVVPASVRIERNAIDGATVLVRPDGVLPSSAQLRVWTSGLLVDITDEGDAPGQDRMVGSFVTEPALQPQFGVLAQPLGDAAVTTELGPARLPAQFDGTALHGAELPPDPEPGANIGDWQPTSRQTVLDTDSDVLIYTTGGYREVRGGVFRVRNLYVPEGYVVSARGRNPLVFEVEGDARIDGTISVRGEDARPEVRPGFFGAGDVTTASSSGLRSGTGGRGQTGGWDGGDSTASISTGYFGNGLNGAGWGLFGFTGGRAGQMACSSCVRGSAGGGGSFATVGDPGYPTDPSAGATGFPQRLGIGGAGCAGSSGAATRSLAGGAAGQSVFIDQRADNDFFGITYEPRRGITTAGELGRLVGGNGGASGGDFVQPSCVPGYYGQLQHGGAGGAGGGAVMLQVGGRIEIGRHGRVVADGGNGVAGDISGRGAICGGGGGGSGGMVVVRAGERIVLHAHGETFAQRDYDFAISADGGICTVPSSASGLPVIASKYPASGQPPLQGSVYDARPLGGFGGFGLIQLMTPVGLDNDDDTNTVLDDSVDVVRDGVLLRTSEKIRYLAWRGLITPNGAFVDDYGNLTFVAWGEGDLRPSPHLMPATFSPRTFARTGWLALGAVVRRPLAHGDGEARGVVNGSVPVGPDFAVDSTDDGWLRFEQVGQRLEPSGAELLGPAAIASIETAFEAGRAVHVVALREPVLGDEPDRFSGALALLRGPDGTAVARERVASHDRGSLRLFATAVLPRTVTALRLVHCPVDLAEDAIPAWRAFDGRLVPRSNVRIGFAFHRAPEHALPSGIDPERFPQEVGTFVFRLDDPATAAALRAFHATHVQCELTIDRRWHRTDADRPPVVDAQSDLHVTAIWLPFRF
jgi:hypothetical protein